MAKGGGSTVTTAPTGPASTYLTGVMNKPVDYTAVQNATGAADAQQWNDFYNSVVPQLNQRATFLGNPTGAIKDLNSAVSNISKNQSWNADQAYLNEYNLGQNRALDAANMLGHTTTTTQTPGSGATLASILGGGIGLAGLYNLLKGGSAQGSGGGLGKDLVSGGQKLYNWMTGGNPADYYGTDPASIGDAYSELFPDAAGNASSAAGGAPYFLSNSPDAAGGLAAGSPDWLGGAGGSGDAITGIDLPQVASGAQATGAAAGGSSVPGEVAGWSTHALGGAAAAAPAAIPALSAADIAGSAGIGGDAAIEAAIQSGADASAAGGFGLGGAGAASGGGGAGAAAGSLGLGLAGVGATLAAPLYGMSRPAYTDNSDFNSRMTSYLKAGPGPYASTKGFNGISWDPQYVNYMRAMQWANGTFNPNPMGQGGGGSGGGNIAGRK